ncbi:serine/threonine protein kinase [Ideonella sp. YS5]|uniref:serine/threonine protein kinase n=1 Tax=Ideonella sp. YS5 TaxID=3453714 RepID=UPI003EECB604
MPEISEDATPAAVPPPLEELNALSAGTRFGELEILRTLAVGGFGIVYVARDHALERQVAIKEYMPGQLAQRFGGSLVSVRSASYSETFDVGRRSFVNEAKLLARFDHRSLLKVYRFWEDNGTAYMLMPYLQGRTLKQARQEMRGRPSQTWLLGLMKPLLDALELLHAESVYHRDISPDNILLPDDGGDPILLDFGAARHAIGDGTQALTAILKPRFAPIEQYGEAAGLRQGPWTDLYALGAVMYYLLLGHTPPAATTRTLVDSYQPLARMGLTGYSPSFLAAIDWSLGVRPQDRPTSAAQMRAALLGELSPPAPAPAAPGASEWEHTVSFGDEPSDNEAIELPLAPAGSTRLDAARRRSRRAVVFIGSAALAAAGLTWWALQAHRHPADTGSPPTAESTPGPVTAPSSVAAAAPPSGVAPKQAAASAAPRPLDPRQACEGRNFIAKEICLARQCQKPAYANHAECVKQRDYRTQRERFGN